MGRFTLPMLLDVSAFRRILTILARGYLHRADGSAYDRIENRTADAVFLARSYNNMNRNEDAVDLCRADMKRAQDGVLR